MIVCSLESCRHSPPPPPPPPLPPLPLRPPPRSPPPPLPRPGIIRLFAPNTPLYPCCVRCTDHVPVRTCCVPYHPLCCYIDELKEGFLPFLQPVVEIMVPLLDFYFHEDVRKAAVASLPDILRAGKAAMEKGCSTPQAGGSLRTTTRSLTVCSQLTSLREENINGAPPQSVDFLLSMTILPGCSGRCGLDAPAGGVRHTSAGRRSQQRARGGDPGGHAGVPGRLRGESTHPMFTHDVPYTFTSSSLKPCT